MLINHVSVIYQQRIRYFSHLIVDAHGILNRSPIFYLIWSVFIKSTSKLPKQKVGIAVPTFSSSASRQFIAQIYSLKQV